MYRDIPTIDEMSKDLPQHINFYIRGVFNSMLPEFLNPLSSTVRAEDVSGEMLEALRFVAKGVAPDLQEGEVAAVTYEDLRRLFNEKGIFEDMQIETIRDQISTSLGQFGITMQDGQYVVFDTYDFEDRVGNRITKAGGTPVFSDYLKEMEEETKKKGFYGAARVMGGYLMPENLDGSGDDDSMKIRIKIPREPEVIETEFDNDPQTENFVFRGAMTTKRKSMFDQIFSGFFGRSADAEEMTDAPAMPRPRPKQEVAMPAPRPEPEQVAMANQETPTDEQASNMRFG